MFRARQKVGKYLIESKLGDGGFAMVYRALDTIEGVRVALKVPHPTLFGKESLDEFRKEIRIMASLEHPNILKLKNAEFINDQFVVAFPLGEKSLEDRLQHRISAPLALSFFEQILEALAYAHEKRIMHCDIKPGNLLLFPDNELKLTDFGIAKIASRTINASGSGTVGHVAPEQAMGKPSFRSDVFSIGLIGYRMFSGQWPEWPFDWPPPGFERIRGTLDPDFVALLRRSLELDPKKRFRNAQQMLAGFQRIKNRAIRKQRASISSRQTQTKRDWKTLRFSQFRKQFGKSLETNCQCSKCQGPVSEPMICCPWCGDSRAVFKDVTSFPRCCPRCNRGLKLDWEYCPWCFGPGFEVETSRQFPDSRYAAKCSSPKCDRQSLMPFMRYCPWCRTKVRRKWKLAGTKDSCKSCGCGVAKEYWSFCPWCGKGMNPA